LLPWRPAVYPPPAAEKGCQGWVEVFRVVVFAPIHPLPEVTLRDEYLKEAQKVIPDANILINVVSRRVKQLKYGMKPLVESLEKLEPEDVALREVIEGKIDYELWVPAEET
jgi:DNA-directed RNA polymerase subunit omega